MPRVVLTTAASVGGYAFKKGDVVELIAAQITSLGSSARSVLFRDQLGEATGASNTSA
jgi:hypothetical protein